MKKITISLTTALLCLVLIPTPASAVSKSPVSIVVTTSAEALEAKTLLNRLDEIKAMDKSELRASDKKKLRKEVRAIKQNLENSSGGVYLSVGSIILLAILLVLLL